MEELPKSTCATDLTSQCLCTNTALNLAVAACSQKTCTIYELMREYTLVTCRPHTWILMRSRDQEYHQHWLWSTCSLQG